ncbi:MAG: flagellar motor protein [Myxococcaceae bacterium]|nr:flagellar motor protein [Myxococcaceae bacterium]
MDKLTFGGIALAIGSILGGQALEGGHAGSLVQLTAFMIVMGGTIGAVMIAYPQADFIRGLKLGKAAFKEEKADIGGLVKQLVDMAAVARRDGVLALESKLAGITDPFLKRAVGFVVDGVDAAVARSALEGQIEAEFEENTVGAKVFESAGGFSPTVGILGAVLGLIHVMENLSNPDAIGPGIAVAFVATVYGVGSSNLVFLPMANKIKRRLGVEKERKILIAEGVLSIQEGLNPRVLEEKLNALSGGHGGGGGGHDAKQLKAA